MFKYFLVHILYTHHLWILLILANAHFPQPFYGAVKMLIYKFPNFQVFQQQQCTENTFTKTNKKATHS